MTTRTKVVADEHGVVFGFRHHDGHLDAVVFDRSRRRVQLELCDVEGGRVVVHCDGVAWSWVSGLALVNVVATLWLFERPRLLADATLRQRLLADCGAEALAAVDRAVGQELLFVVECATGAAATILAKQVSFEPGSLQPGSVAPGGDGTRAADAERSP